MKVYYDLHIHSVLSSCCDVLSTPNNILNMVMLKELDMISITDHNSLLQYQTIEQLKESYDYLIIYGVEITTNEGFHILVYLDSYEKTIILNNLIFSNIDHDLKNDDSIGQQIICDEFDEVKLLIDFKLNQPIKIPYSILSEEIRKLDGIIVMSHINRRRSGVLDYYESIEHLDFDAIEISNDGYGNCDYMCSLSQITDEILNKHKYLKKYKILYNSDSHNIDTINERKNYIEINHKSFSDFKKWIKNE